MEESAHVQLLHGLVWYPGLVCSECALLKKIIIHTHVQSLWVKIKFTQPVLVTGSQNTCSSFKEMLMQCD